MIVTLPDVVLVPYGCDRLSADAPFVSIDRSSGEPLRLNTSQYEPALAPDLQMSGDDQAAYLRDYLKRLCRPWDGLSVKFLDWYFASLAAHVDANRAQLTARLGAAAGLYRADDWLFSAPIPLPRAHLRVSAGEAGGDELVQVDFAFWLGQRFVAARSAAAISTPRKAAEQDARLRAAAVDVVRLTPNDLTAPCSPLFSRLLPSPQDFWSGQKLPMGPFRPELNFG
jgi:hypothetical protein